MDFLLKKLNLKKLNNTLVYDCIVIKIEVNTYLRTLSKLLMYSKDLGSAKVVSSILETVI